MKTRPARRDARGLTLGAAVRVLAGLGALGALGVLGACGVEPGGPQRLELHLQYGAYGAGICTMTPECAEAGSCPFDCAQRIGLFLVDAKTDAVLDSACVSLPAASGGGALRTVADLPAALAGLDFSDGVTFGREVILEIAVYADSAVPDCTRAKAADPMSLPIDDDGINVPNFWGRSAPVTIAEGANRFDLPVECVIPPLTCSQAGTRVTGLVDDLGLLLPPSNISQLDVRIGLVVPGQEMGAMPTFVNQAQLTLPDQLIPEWTRDLDNGVSTLQPCGVGTLVLKATPPVGYPVLSCESVGIDPGTGLVGTTLAVHGYHIERSDVDAMIAGLGLPGFPTTGLLVGRVVDESRIPVAGATVAALDGMATVIYLDGTFMPRAAAETDDSGWFVVKDLPSFPPIGGMPGAGGDVPCCGQLYATTSDNRTGCTASAVGLVEGVVMATLIDISTASSCNTPP